VGKWAIPGATAVFSLCCQEEPDKEGLLQLGTSVLLTVGVVQGLKHAIDPGSERSPQHAVWLSYNTEADTLYVNFKKPSYATNSKLTDEDIIVRYEGEAVIGFTVLHASKRVNKTA
jgi:uncharacterized protein YuzE